MEIQGGGGDNFPHGVNSQNNLSFNRLPLYNNHQGTPSSRETKRILEVDPSFNLNQNQEINESVKGGSNDISSRRKGHWSTQEDRKFLSLVNKHGAGKWTQIAQELDGRDAKQCSARWNNHLRPNIKKDMWSLEEEKVFIEAHEILGNKWAEIAKRIPGRSENSIKNHWYATNRKLNRLKKNEATILQDYINAKISKETNVPTSNNPNTASPSSNFASDDQSSNLKIS